MTGYNSQAGVQTYGPWTYPPAPVTVGPPKAGQYDPTGSHWEDTFEVTRNELLDLLAEDDQDARWGIIGRIYARGANR
jgi:hypothetical protein